MNKTITLITIKGAYDALDSMLILKKDKNTVIAKKRLKKFIKDTEESQRIYCNFYDEWGDVIDELNEEIASLRQTVSDLSQKLDMMGYEG